MVDDKMQSLTVAGIYGTENLVLFEENMYVCQKCKTTIEPDWLQDGDGRVFPICGTCFWVECDEHNEDIEWATDQAPACCDILNCTNIASSLCLACNGRFCEDCMAIEGTPNGVRGICRACAIASYSEIED